MLTEQEIEAILVDVHRAIEESAARTAAELAAKTIDLTYPPNHGFSQTEYDAIKQLRITPDCESAFRKIFAHVAAAPLFHLFELLDGVGDPTLVEGLWLGAVLSSPEEPDARGNLMMLHDWFYESYWKWRELREPKDWTLDTYEG